MVFMVFKQAVVVATDLAIALESLPLLKLVFIHLRHMLHDFNAAESFPVDAIMLDEFLMLEHHAVEDLFVMLLKVLSHCLVSFVENT